MELDLGFSGSAMNDRELLSALRATPLAAAVPENATVVYTDGACSGNPGPGGWAWAISPTGTPNGSGSEKPSTNQRMELYAVIDALRSLHHINSVVEVRSDSTYVVKCFTDKWWQGWLTRGWKNSQRQAVANQDLWEQLLAEVVKRGPEKTFFTWVKGHSGEPMNDLVDALAVAAASA